MASPLKALFWTLGLVYAAVLTWAGFVFPERVPMHWSGSGGPDRWGTRTEAIITLVILGLIVMGIFGALIVSVPRSGSLKWINVPGKTYWKRPENLGQAMRKIAVDLSALGCLVMGYICSVPVAIVAAANKPDAALPSWSLVIFIAWLALFAAYGVWMVAFRWRPPRA